MKTIDYLLAHCRAIRFRRNRRPQAADAAGCGKDIAVPVLLLAALLMTAPSGAALAAAIGPSNDVVAAAPDRPPLEFAREIAAPSVNCGGSGDADAGVIPLRSDFAACFGEDWLAIKSPFIVDPFREDYALSPFNRRIARLLKQLSSGLGGFGEDSDESVEAAIVNTFRLDVQDHKNAVDELDSPESLQYQSVDSDGDALSAGFKSASAGGAAPRVVTGGELPEPFRTVFAIFDEAMHLASDTRTFLRDNQWMFFSPALAFIPLGLMQLRRRRRRYR